MIRNLTVTLIPAFEPVSRLSAAETNGVPLRLFDVPFLGLRRLHALIWVSGEHRPLCMTSLFLMYRHPDSTGSNQGVTEGDGRRDVSERPAHATM